MSIIDDLMAALQGIPRWPGCRCKGRSDVWDTYDDPQLVEYAINQCNACPALTDCRAWLDSLPASQRPHGVVAAQVRRPPRPRKEIA